MSGSDHFLDESAQGVPGWNMRFVAETGSTNADLLAEVELATPDRTVLRTDHQTAGRGRLDRTWEAPPGSNLLMSVLFRDVPDDANELTRRVGLAAVAAVSNVAGVAAQLKWPNDVLVGGRKLAGILAQRAVSGPVVVGIGLNVGWAPPDAVSLGAEFRPHDIAVALLAAYDALPSDIDALYRSQLGTLGQRVRVQRTDSTLEGRALDVERDGRLVVLDDCGVSHRIDVGDVVHLRPAE
ncbi:MAG TPA: biotin--[acetyl-CoA-carboxylase] ligase [Ilumatobacter sp.]|nr:biotin--[acetyl-CoA-carboxylase] ligase [Ilumatobacter sp.]